MTTNKTTPSTEQKNLAGQQPATPSANGEAIDFSKLSYSQLVWLQFRKKKIAMAALYTVGFLLLVAVFAPLFIGSRPYYIRIGDGPLESPWLRSLFDIHYYRCTIDLLFNLLMVLSPIFLLGYWVNRRFFHWPGKYLLGAYFATYAIASVVMLSSVTSKPYLYYKDLIEKTEAQGIKVSYAFPPISYSYNDIEPGAHPEPPDRSHWWGTAARGQDVLSAMTFGLRIAFSVGLVAVSIYVAIGVILGALAGYFLGKVDLVISRLIEVMLCFPSLFLILTIAGILEERSIYHVMVIIGLTSWPSVARLTRAEFLKQREMDYVQAAVSLGIPRYRIVFSHILPNAIAPVLVSATFGIAWAILYESTLSFLGVGDPTVASWGELLNLGRNHRQCWWLIIFPGVGIFVVVALFNLLGDGFRDSLDPKLRQ